MGWSLNCDWGRSWSYLVVLLNFFFTFTMSNITSVYDICIHAYCYFMTCLSFIPFFCGMFFFSVVAVVVVVDSLFTVPPSLWEFCVWLQFCNAILRVLTSFAIISVIKRELDGLPCVYWSNEALSAVYLPHDAMGQVSLQCDCGISWS